MSSLKYRLKQLEGWTDKGNMKPSQSLTEQAEQFKQDASKWPLVTEAEVDRIDFKAACRGEAAALLQVFALIYKEALQVDEAKEVPE